MSEETSIEMLTAHVVASYVANNNISASELPGLIQTTYASLTGTAKPVETEKPALTPPVSIRKSITPDALISMEDGRSYKSLRRHLATRGLTPEEYRTKWGLPNDYPMVSPNYSAQRSALAKTLGLGRKPAAAVPAPAKKAAKIARPVAKKASPPKAEAAPAKTSPAKRGRPIKPKDGTFS